jgi:hypothetical protein
MRVNERLYVIGLMDEFDKAVEEVVEILKRVEITEESSIKLILEELGLNKKSPE